MSNSTADRGPLVWESPSVKNAPTLLLRLVGGAFLALSIGLALTVRGLWSPSLDQTEQGRRVAFGLIGISAIFGSFLIYTSFFPPKIPGVLFFARGVEFGPPSRRRYFSYSSLEHFRLEVISLAQHQRDDTIALTQAVASIIAANPSGIGYALGRLNRKKVYAMIAVKPPSEREFRVALFKDARSKMEPLFKS